MTINQQDPSEKARPGTVTRVFRSVAPAILWITLANGTVLGTTPDHGMWTHEDGWTKAKHVEVGDSFATRDGSCVVVTHLRLDPTPAEVFNLEVAGFYTYFVNNIWVHNAKCQLHHFATNKHSFFTPRMQKTVDKYGLDLDDLWNTEMIEQLGRHPNDYHRFVEEGMQRAANEAGNNINKFLDLFDEYVKEPVRRNPNLLNKSGWQ